MGIPFQSLRDTHSSPTLPPTELPMLVVKDSAIHQSIVLIHYTYPLFILVFFLAALTWWGIHTASKKPKPAWASPPRVLPSSPICPKSRSPNRSGTSQRGFVNVSDLEDGDLEDDRYSDVVLQGKLDNGRRLIDKLRMKFIAWFNGDLEDFLEDKQGAQYSGFQSHRKKVGLTPIRRAMFHWGVVFVILSYMANAANIILHALTNPGWWCGQDVVISNISLLFIWGLTLLSQLDAKQYPTVPHVLTWIVALGFEVTLIAMNLVLNYRPSDGHEISSYKYIALGVDVFRIIILFTLICVYISVIVVCAEIEDENTEQNEREDSDSDEQPEREDYDESTGLLAPSGVSVSTERRNRRRVHKRVGYGTMEQGNGEVNRKAGPASAESGAPAGWARRNIIGVRQSWWEYLRGYTVFFPYLWPSNSRRLQFLAVICFLLVLIQRVVNLLVPYQLETITNLLTQAYEHPVPPGEPPLSALSLIPWFQISLYIVYRLLQGSMGLVGAVRSILWIPIGQYSYQALSTSAFEHVHSLSLDFHLGKKTGEVLSALSKGSAINNFLEMVTFQVVPMLVDLGVAVAFFLIHFDAYYALIVAIVTFCYLYITIRMAQWRADIRREMTNKSREEDAVKNDSMIAYETVKYFNAEQYEFTRYRNAVNAFQRAEYQVLFSLNVMNVSQNIMFMIGLLVACYLSAWQVSTGQTKVGKFVGLLAYLAQLQGPLNFFGTFYRSIQSSMINSERMLELFKEKPTVVDAPHAKPLGPSHGEIKFDNVHFSYDQRKPALKGLSFTASPGTTTAFVGESGGGKTTVLRLLFRFYNINDGSISIDGQDVRDVTIDSLRERIGVVPQDTVLFNETVMYNLKYANADATDEMVYEACRAASIHDKIMSFPDGYNTKVGERGLRLSGGEKQRVAIARTVLKNPRVILLDEATAALDSETEQHIQKALKELSVGRTTLVIAHRLSTITSANQILCIHQGKVAERGTHEELLKLNGRYAMMWTKQVKAEKEARENEGDESQDGQQSPVASDEGDSSVELSGLGTMGEVVPSGQEEVVGMEVEIEEQVKETVTPPSTGGDGAHDDRGGFLTRSSVSSPSSDLRRGVRWNTAGLTKAMRKREGGDE